MYIKQTKNDVFGRFWGTFRCFLDSKVINFDNIDENTWFGNKNNGLLHFGGNLWPKIGQN